ncbi:glycosyltransferase family 4 protein [Lentzea sp. PSKA42]|uniref:Glycosyltransferase family 4 protein n=1 Tax=Lentzea indica TaxID=2604800 RepID=A0ABX1FXD4_9PSEU|nr:glycosyltransferase [Lentzea indica]NKE63723.1 glycosyltransferase family 4 protein [Lentzea indica]
MRILLWHVHGSWTHSFVQGRHDYLIPGPPHGIGLAGRPWRATETDLSDVDPDIVVVQRLEELSKIPPDVPTVYLEHNTPSAPSKRHPLADWDGTLVHVTHFNDLMWDCGTTRTVVIEHGVVDPGPLYTGELPSAATVINEPVRRGRIVGTDLLPRFEPIDVFGMGTEQMGTGQIGGMGDHELGALHRELARRRVYVHTPRWTSLGLSLLEAMHIGMPVVALASTEAIRAVPAEAGAISTNVEELVSAAGELIADPALALDKGKRAREHALARYGLDAFLRNWDALLKEVIG